MNRVRDTERGDGRRNTRKKDGRNAGKKHGEGGS